MKKGSIFLNLNLFIISSILLLWCPFVHAEEKQPGVQVTISSKLNNYKPCFLSDSYWGCPDSFLLIIPDTISVRVRAVYGTVRNVHLVNGDSFGVLGSVTVVPASCSALSAGEICKFDITDMGFSSNGKVNVMGNGKVMLSFLLIVDD